MKRNSVRALSSLVIVLNLASPLVYGVGGFKFSEKNLDLNFKTITYDNLELSPQRLSVINNFLMMATIAWEPKENMHYWNPKLEKVRKNGELEVIFKKGEQYYGIPYSQSNRYTSIPVFLQNLEFKGGKNYYTGPIENYLGSDCSSAVMYAFKGTVDPYLDFVYTGGNYEDEFSGFSPVGDFKFDPELFDEAGTLNIDKVGTLEIVKKNGKDVMLKSYEQLMPGDVILKHVDGGRSGHVRMVLSVDKDKKTLVCADQAGVNDECKLKGQNGQSTWQIDKEYTFEEIFKDGYIPLANSKLLESEKAMSLCTLSKANFKISQKNLNLNFKNVEYDGLELSPQRLSVINNFLMMATVAWAPKEDIHYWNPKLEKTGKTGELEAIFKKGEQYCGIPYSQKERNTPFPIFVLNLKTENDKSYYTCPTEKYLGSDCSSAVMYAFKETVDPLCDFLYTGGNSKNEIGSFEPVGKIKFSNEIFKEYGTLEIVNRNGKESTFRSYESLMPGDVILKRIRNKDGGGFGHIRMVLAINKEEKTLICADQTGVNDEGKLKGQNGQSTWQIDKECSFEELFKEGYIPLANSKLLESEKKNQKNKKDGNLVSSEDSDFLKMENGNFMAGEV